MADPTSTLTEITRVAHAGGLDGLTEGEALVRIRRLTLPWWQAVADAIGDAVLAVPACPSCHRPLPNLEPRSCMACDWKEAARG